MTESQPQPQPLHTRTTLFLMPEAAVVLLKAETAALVEAGVEILPSCAIITGYTFAASTTKPFNTPTG